MKLIWAVLVVELVCGGLFSYGQSPAELAALKLASALSDADQGYESASNLARRVEDAVNGHPAPLPSNWSSFVTQLNKAADELEGTPILPHYVATANTVSTAEVLDCKTHHAALLKLEDFQREMALRWAHNQEMLIKLNAAHVHADGVDQIISEIQKLYNKAVMIPAISASLVADWYSVSVDAPKAAGRIRSAIEKQQKQYKQDDALYRTERSNFGANLNELENHPICNPFKGTWISTPSAVTQQFGGQNGLCTWEVTMDNIQMKLSIDDSGSITEGIITSTMHERNITCNRPNYGTKSHTYRFASGRATDLGIAVHFAPDQQNLPKAKADLAVTSAAGGRLQGFLAFSRYDDVPQVNWVLTTQLK